MAVKKHTSFYNYSVTFFLYATLFIDLYRKEIGISTEAVRNFVYAIVLVSIMLDSLKTKHITHMLFLGGGMSLLYLFSSAINPGYKQIFFSAWFLFISRLWPAYYIGRFTEDWSGVSQVVRKFIWIALLYAIIGYTSSGYDSDLGSFSSYATIAKNLFFVVWIALYDSFHSHKLSFIICLICFIPILFFGTRACLIGALLALVLYYMRVIQKSNTRGKVLYFMLLCIVCVCIVVLFTSLSSFLYELFPNSRTITYFIEGNILDDSNRTEQIYSKMLESIKEKPLKIYGLVGNQIAFADINASSSEILRNFAHNVYLELCMNFGLVFGLLLSIYFTIVMVKAYVKSKMRSKDMEYVYLGIVGMSFVNMMISFSWVFSYEVWLLFGLAYRIVRTRKNSNRTVVTR